LLVKTHYAALIAPDSRTALTAAQCRGTLLSESAIVRLRCSHEIVLMRRISIMDTPRGLEVLLKKAAVDAEFRTLLLERRSGACAVIDLELDPAEVAMLDAMPTAQLNAIIQRTRVRPEDRRVFLGKAASVMLAALGAGVSGCVKKSFGVRPDRVKTTGIQPDRVERAKPADAPAPAEGGAPDPNRAPGVPPEHDSGATSTT
jgi:hypothetical protein